MSMDCPGLKSLYGDCYRITIDESYFAETGSTQQANTDPWLWLIPCRHGHICPWGPDQLAAVFEGHPIMSRQLAEAGFPVLQDGDDGRTVGFHPDQFQQVAVVIQPHRRPRLSEELLQRKREQMREINSRRQCVDENAQKRTQDASAVKT